MKWSELSATVSRAREKYPLPAMIVIHLGSNDIGLRPCSDIIDDIKTDTLRFKLLFPNTRVIWSELLMRRYWHSATKSGTRLEKVRKRINTAIKNFYLTEGLAEIRHPNIRASEIDLYRFDGVHLTDLGNDVLLNNFEGALETFLSSPDVRSFP